MTASSGPEGATSAASAGRMSTLPITGTASTPPPGQRREIERGQGGQRQRDRRARRRRRSQPATCESGSAAGEGRAGEERAAGRGERRWRAARRRPPGRRTRSAPRLAVIGSAAGAVATVARSGAGVALEGGGMRAGEAASSASMDDADGERQGAVHALSFVSRRQGTGAPVRAPASSIRGFWVARSHGPSRIRDRARAEGSRRRTRPTTRPIIPKEACPAILKRTFKQFGEDQLTTWAAALTYYGVLSLFPALLALVALMGVFGPQATHPLLDNRLVAAGPAKDIVDARHRQACTPTGRLAATLILAASRRSGPPPDTSGRSCRPPTSSTTSGRAARSGRPSRSGSA